MRVLPLIVCFVFTIAFAEQQTPRPLTTDDTAALTESVALGQRVLAAWLRYSKAAALSTPIPAGIDAISSTPTLELLHATHSLSDSDFALSLQCQARLHPVPVNAPKDAPALSMQTARGELIFDISGNITLRPLK